MSYAFVSYVREDQPHIDRLCADLMARGIQTWIDREEILPGQRWQEVIRKAIRDGAFFLACFSDGYLSKSRSYMNEEINFAVEELRVRPHGRIWFIPVLLEPCTLPTRQIGGGQLLSDLQWVPLHENWNRGIDMITRAISTAIPADIADSDAINYEIIKSSGAEITRRKAIGKKGRGAFAGAFKALRRTLSEETKESHRTLSRERKKSRGDIVRYVDIKRIGEGSFAQVYEAFDHMLNRKVAIKRLKRGLGADPSLQDELMREARLASTLAGSSNIVSIYDLGLDKDRLPYIVMELLSGTTLADLMTNKLPKEALIIDIVMQACAGLDYAHSRNVIHRDIKPSNIMIEREEHSLEVKLVDFGTAHLLGGPEDLLLRGTPLYMAPEQFQPAPKSLTEAADIYATGGVLYHWVTGRPPFSYCDITRLARAHLIETPRPPRGFNRRISGDLEEIILLCLAKEAERRPRAHEVAEAIRSMELFVP